MNVPGGGKNDIPNRLKRQFCIFYVPPPSPAAVNSIFGALVQARLWLACASAILCYITEQGKLNAMLQNRIEEVYNWIEDQMSWRVSTQIKRARQPYHHEYMSYMLCVTCSMSSNLEK